MNYECETTKSGSGFSLLEILVAMAILSVIILMMTTIFNQSSQAWDRGLSQSQKGMEGRAALNLMARELKSAVVGEDTDFVAFAPTAMSFDMLSRNSGSRAIQYVEYKYQGGKIERRTTTYKDDYTVNEVSPWSVLLGDVSGFSIATTPWSPTNLPYSVTLSIEFEKSSDTAWAEAYSFGPDGIDDSGLKDDVSSEER